MLARLNRTIVNANSGIVAPSASVEIRVQQSGALASLFSDVDGLTAIDNPTTADVNGFVGVFLQPNNYRIISRATPGGAILSDITYEPILNPFSSSNAVAWGIFADTGSPGIVMTVEANRSTLSQTNFGTFKVTYRNDGADREVAHDIKLIAPILGSWPHAATLGIPNSTDDVRVWLYLCYDATLDNGNGTVRLGISRSVFPEDSLQSATELTASSTSSTVLYTFGGAMSNVAVARVGEMYISRATDDWDSVDDLIFYNGRPFTRIVTVNLTSDSGIYATPVNLEVKCLRSGDMVTLFCSDFSYADANSDEWLSFSGLPKEFRPLFGGGKGLASVINNSQTEIIGSVNVDFDTLSFGANTESDGNFETTGNKGVGMFTITYPVF